MPVMKQLVSETLSLTWTFQFVITVAASKENFYKTVNEREEKPVPERKLCRRSAQDDIY